MEKINKEAPVQQSEKDDLESSGNNNINTGCVAVRSSSGNSIEQRKEVLLKLKSGEEAFYGMKCSPEYKSNWMIGAEWVLDNIVAALPQNPEQSIEPSSLSEDEIYDSVYMEVVQLVEKDNRECDAYINTALELMSKYKIERK